MILSDCNHGFSRARRLDSGRRAVPAQSHAPRDPDDRLRPRRTCRDSRMKPFHNSGQTPVRFVLQLWRAAVLLKTGHSAGPGQFSGGPRGRQTETTQPYTGKSMAAFVGALWPSAVRPAGLSPQLTLPGRPLVSLPRERSRLIEPRSSPETIRDQPCRRDKRGFPHDHL